MVDGYVINNSTRAKHIFKRTVRPGQRVPLKDVFFLYEKKVPAGSDPIEWLRKNVLPHQWGVVLQETGPYAGMYKETLEATPLISDRPIDLGEFAKEEEEPQIQEKPGGTTEHALRPKEIEKLTAREIASLKIKDNPRKVIAAINSLFKLRRALTYCRQDGHKDMLTKIIQHRIRELNITL